MKKVAALRFHIFTKNTPVMSQKQLKSLEILKKFVAETPVNQVQALVEKYAKLEVTSPTMAQYLSSAVLLR